ncbi:MULTISPECIES: PfkB family carbohydrate kinase [Prauserella salsuginis group]|uniref:PfkB family carbohydrate kinase n=1 Tax=Prauserella salsuginis TaxID=387889 RepID=A0ABW6G4R3_9PSEU|nr:MULTISPECIES: PfkB family carbohydrate kinase [Prauserella salsuginis group]MCR3718747.1 Sugar or nucleoside kinase, ribokinase family [Prauserella flava]MCR3733317.1 Sugar or nucleoside kinase, ribokinase family [Prauserella salsuginis]
MTGRLVHTGQVILDLVMRVDSLPEPGGDVLASETALLPGGGFNVMAAAARSGAQVVYAGAHGTGQFGDRVRSALHDEGVTAACPPSEESDTGVCVALVDDSGERTFVTGSGAEAGLTAERLADVKAGPGDVVYVSGYSLLHGANRAALAAWLPSVDGAAVLLDPGPLASQIPQEVLDSTLSQVDILSTNAREARGLTGSEDLHKAAAELADRLRPSSTVVVRDGAAGCLVAMDGTVERVDGFPVSPVDTNGAGDAHCGVLAAMLLDGATLRAAARRANAAAALSVLRPGPATAPTAAELNEFLLPGG